MFFIEVKKHPAEFPVFHYPIEFSISSFKDHSPEWLFLFPCQSALCSVNPYWAISFKSLNPGSIFIPNIETEQNRYHSFYSPQPPSSCLLCRFLCYWGCSVSTGLLPKPFLNSVKGPMGKEIRRLSGGDINPGQPFKQRMGLTEVSSWS